ncbi:MAG: MlaA family lipoprotein [Lysobacteraceae bacterium]
MSQPDRFSNAAAIVTACLIAATSAQAQSSGTNPVDVSQLAPPAADVVMLDASAADVADMEKSSSAATAMDARSAETRQPNPAEASPQLASDTAAEKAELPAYLQSDPNAEAAALVPDPWERYNRSVYRFNKRFDKALLKPLALGYVRVVPKPVRNSVAHFFENLVQPITSVNLLLQGHPQRSINSLGRFAVNTTLGIGGLFDPASSMHIPPYNEDFGQTLGHWGWRRSRYFLIPFLGPGTLRDRIGSLSDGQLGPYKFVHPTDVRVGLIGLSILDTRVQILPLDELSVGIDDDYLLVREAWNARRMHQIDDQALRITDDPSLPTPAPSAQIETDEMPTTMTNGELLHDDPNQPDAIESDAQREPGDQLGEPPSEQASSAVIPPGKTRP